jgi:hypothetical protein
VTTENNPDQTTFVHVHKMTYTGEGAQKEGLASFYIPLTDEDIRSGTKM